MCRRKGFFLYQILPLIGIIIGGCESRSPVDVEEFLKPKAYAGADVISKVGRYTILNGRASTSINGGRFFYSWKEDKNNPVPLTAYFYAQSLFVPFTKEGTYRYRLTVYDGMTLSEPDEVVITVGPRGNVIFEDTVLEIDVRRALSAPEEELTDERLLDVDTLRTGAPNSLSGLEKCTRLVALSLHGGYDSGCPSDLTPLSGLTSLQKLVIEYNASISDLSPLQHLVGLHELSLWGMSFSDISPISSLTNLEHLRLLSHDTLDISSLGTLTGLQSADFSFTPLKGISCFSTLPQIEELRMDYCGLKDISPLQSCTQLTYLVLAGNSIEDVSPLVSLHRWLTLILSYNNITSLKPFVDSQEMHLNHLYLDGNPLDSLSVNVYIPELRKRGIDVRF